MKRPTRPEQEVFADLAALCVCPGYVHAIAHFCFRDNVVVYAGKMKEADLQKMFAPSRLIRSEINTLIGLMAKAEVDWTLPTPATVQEYLDSTEQLLEELHSCVSGQPFADLTEEAIASGSFDPFGRGEAMREPIFYSGEAAYNFQYLDLAVRKYAADSAWLEANRGFNIEQACRVVRAVDQVHAEQFSAAKDHLRKQPPDQWTMVPFFAVNGRDVAAKTGLAQELVDRVLNAFALPSTERNAGFGSLHDFNATTASPLLRIPSGEFLSLQSYSLAESLYESPFYWMAQDKAYLPTLTKNRGDFTEHFVAERLELVFGTKNVFLNVGIFETKAEKVSEIDVLVVWGDRVVVVQTKSKRLTLEARKGNDQIIRDDFKKAVQAAYDQGVVCAKSLLDKKHKIETLDSREVTLPDKIKEIYVLCVVSDHYPALSFQARQFLETKVVERVQPPLVMDVFTVDAMTEMLQSPLQFLSYTNRRANYADQLLVSQELTILGYHLKHNLWVRPDVGLMHLHDDFSVGLDVAMAVRRAGVGGPATPDGILTRFSKTTLGRVVASIEARPEPPTIDLGFFILAMGEKSVKDISSIVDRLAARSRTDGSLHDGTFAFNEAGGSGITFHCTDEPTHIAGPRLAEYCRLRKYKERAKAWFGLCMSPKGPDVRFGVSLSYPWIEDAAMNAITGAMQTPIPPDQVAAALDQGRRRAKKVGRNDPCPCGSGRKYKKCCLN